MNEKSIRDRLVKHGQRLFRAPKQPIAFTKEPQADALLNDLDNHPHAFVLACVMDRQVKAERAWLIPYRISEKIGGFSINILSALLKEDVNRLMREPEPLHRFVDTMANHFYSGVQRIKNNYAGDASRIWSDKPSSAEVVYRFLEFDGVGPKIGSMAANILARQFRIPFSDYYSIDISPDVHILRVMKRMGFVAENANNDMVIYKARELNPKFPGIIDFSCWEIGRNWCKPKNPICSECIVKDECEKIY